MRAATVTAILGVGLLGLPVLLLSACPPSSDERCMGAACGVDAGMDVQTPACLTKEPKDAPECVNDEFGVFVSASGDDNSGSGTKARPVRTLGKAMSIVQDKPRIYVCAGEYKDANDVLKLDAAHRVSVYGGFDCASWLVTDGKSVTVAPPGTGPALSITNVSKAVTIADIAFVTQNAPDNSGQSSIAGWIAQSDGGITLRRVMLTAGKGASGKAAAAAPGDYPGRAPNGVDAAQGGGAAENLCPAPIEKSIGAAGGEARKDGGAGEPSLPEIYPAGFTGAGGVTNASSDCASGPARAGAYGPGGTAGAGASARGTLTVAGWTPQAGQPGGNGRTAQGGGGGAGFDAHGGGGGAGGCGGTGGEAGQGGGASFALLVFQSKVKLEASTLAASDAGNGGQGGIGQKGQLGSAAKGVGSGSDSCDGALGGIGGSGAGGGGGAGGVSIALAYQGTRPTIDGAEVTGDAEPNDKLRAGKKGDPGRHGLGAKAAREPPLSNPSRAGFDGTDGVDGIAKGILALP